MSLNQMNDTVCLFVFSLQAGQFYKSSQIIDIIDPFYYMFAFYFIKIYCYKFLICLIFLLSMN